MYLDEPGGGAAYVAQLAEELAGQIRVETCPLDPKQLGRSMVGWIETYRRARGNVRASGATLLHAHGVRAAALGVVLAKTTGLPVVCTVHGLHSIRRSPTKWIRALNRAVLQRVRIIFALSQSDEAQIRALKLRPLPLLLVTPPLFKMPGSPKEADEPLPVPPDTFLALWVGRLAYEKNPLLMVSIIEQCDPAIHALIVGDGPLRAEVAEAVNASAARQRLHLLGWLSSIESVYSQGDAFVSTALWEGMPLAGLEAASEGLPLILTRVAGNRDLATIVPETVLFDVVAEAASELDKLRRIDPRERRVRRKGQAVAVRTATNPERAASAVLNAYGEAGLIG